MENKLIILRGPSASGKTTVAKKLFELAKNKVVLIQQDYYRFIFKPAGGGSKSNSKTVHKMIEHNVSIALKSGYDVILEGILSVRSYQDILERIINSHQGKSYIFYFDISFEEKVQRHKAKGNLDYGEKEMEQWYPGAHKSNHELETIIPETYSINQIINKIIETSKLETKP